MARTFALAPLLVALFAFPAFPVGCSSSSDDGPASGSDANVDSTSGASDSSADVITDASGDAKLDSSIADGGPDSVVVDAGDSSSDVGDSGGSGDTGDAGSAHLAPMPLISRGVPAFASSGTAKDANDASYDTNWRSTGAISAATPATLAYDLSSVPTAHRAQVVVAWYNTATYNWDHSYFAEVGYNVPGDYVVEGNPAATASSAPTTGWTALATVTGNTLHSRQHLVAFAGYNWIRLRTTKSDGSPSNADVSINLDVHDASAGATDSWIFYGDSITAFAMGTDSAGATGLTSFGQLINAGNPTSTLPKFTGNPAYYPAAEAGGIGGTKTDDALAHIDAWLTKFPGRFVCLSYGTNDVNGNPAGVATAYDNFRKIATKVIAAGKILCVPKVPWAPSTGLQANAPSLNAKIDALYTEFPQMLKGPDLYALFTGKSTLFRDDLHPNAEGIRLYREAWAQAMLAAAYK